MPFSNIENVMVSWFVACCESISNNIFQLATDQRYYLKITHLDYVFYFEILCYKFTRLF